MRRRPRQRVAGEPRAPSWRSQWRGRRSPHPRRPSDCRRAKGAVRPRLAASRTHAVTVPRPAPMPVRARMRVSTRASRRALLVATSESRHVVRWPVADGDKAGVPRFHQCGARSDARCRPTPETRKVREQGSAHLAAAAMLCAERAHEPRLELAGTQQAVPDGGPSDTHPLLAWRRVAASSPYRSRDPDFRYRPDPVTQTRGR